MVERFVDIEEVISSILITCPPKKNILFLNKQKKKSNIDYMVDIENSSVYLLEKKTVGELMLNLYSFQKTKILF